MTINRLNQGTTNQVLVKAISGQTTNLLELQDSSGNVVSSIGPTGALTGIGKILQVVRATDSTSRSTTSTSLTDATGMSVTITPTKSTSAIIIISTFFARINSSTDGNRGFFAITDNSNNLISGAGDSYFGTLNLTGTGSREFRSGAVLIGYATPATTSAVTYKLRFASVLSTTTTHIDNGVQTGQMYAIEVAA